MAYQHYDRLSALDTIFLDLETDDHHMHVGAVAIFDAGPLTDAAGTLDFASVRASMESALQQTPRFRQKLERIPLFDHPVWVDDPRFNLAYHLRHTSLPRPGDERQLKRLAGRILSQKLDLGKPLWEMWFVEGLEGGRFAVIAKAHHCMVDGIGGLDLLAGMMSGDPDARPEPARTWRPRPTPSRRRLVSDELWRRATFPLETLLGARRVLQNPRETLADAREAVLGMSEVLRTGLEPASRTPLNPEIGPFRRYDWLKIDLAAAREVKQRLGGTINDVVLAVAAGAIGRFLRQRGVAPEDLLFRAQVPVSLRATDERGVPGNRVVMLLAELPIGELDPRQRLRRVIQTTRRVKSSRQASGVQMFEQISDHTLTSLFARLAQLALRQRAFNVVVTNVPGPQQPLYLHGARLLEIYPVVPLGEGQGLGIALFSYDGSILWGFNSDWEAMPDLHELVLAAGEDFEELCKAATA